MDLASAATLPAFDPTLPQAVDVDPVIRQVRELIASKAFDPLIARKADRDAIAAFYRCIGAPLWVAAEGQSERAKAVIAHLRSVDADGLDPRDYPVLDLPARTAKRMPKSG